MNAVKARMLKPHEGLKLHRMKRQFVNQVNSRVVGQFESWLSIKSTSSSNSQT